MKAYDCKNYQTTERITVLFAEEEKKLFKSSYYCQPFYSKFNNSIKNLSKNNMLIVENLI